MLKVSAIGNLTKDADVRQAGDSRVAVATLASNRSRNSEARDFIEIECWGELANSDLLVKGAFVRLEGTLVTNSYESSDGGKRKSYRIRARSIESAAKEGPA